MKQSFDNKIKQMNDRVIITTKENDILRKENQVGETPLLNFLWQYKFCDFNNLILL